MIFDNWLDAKRYRFPSRSDDEIDLSLNQANVAIRAGNFDLAAQAANQVLRAKRISKLSRLTADFILIQARSRQGHFSGVFDELDSLFRRVPKKFIPLQARVGNEIIWACYRSGNLGIGAARGEEMLRDFASIWPKADVVELLCQLAACHLHRGDTSRAEENVALALELAETSTSPKAKTQALWQSSVLLLLKGDLSLALQKTNEAKKWADVAGLQSATPALNNNLSLILLGLPNADLRNIQSLAESSYLEATTQNNSNFAAFSCGVLSEVALRREDFDLALMYAKKGLNEMSAEIRGPKTSLLVQVAKVLARMGRFEQSEIELATAMEYMKQEEPSRELAQQWGDIARVFVEIGLADRGVYAYEKAIQMSGLLREEQDSFVE